jgi:hypothetical protein
MKKVFGLIAALCLTILASSSESSTCPRQTYSGSCIQVTVWAANPDTGECCQYPNPCSVPAGWPISYTGCSDLSGLPLCSTVHGTTCTNEGATRYCRLSDNTTHVCDCINHKWDCHPEEW